MSKYHLPILLFSTLALAACGGSDPNPDTPPAPATLTGYFKDSNVAGLNYATATLSGLTGESGEFTYVDGEEVIFSIGGLTLGTATGAEVLTPLSLVENGSLDNPAVVNMVRFLMALDDDGDPSNGISISLDSAVTAGWGTVDFASETFNDDVAAYVAAVGEEAALPNPEDAKIHMTATLRCVYSGAFIGTFENRDFAEEDGVFGFMSRASDGRLIGYAWNNYYEDLIGLDATVLDVDSTDSLTLTQMPEFVGRGTDGGEFWGSFTSTNALEGEWEFSFEEGGETIIEGGPFSGSRIGGMANAKYRYTGTFDGDANGIFAFDIDANNQVSGFGYNVQDNHTFTLTGTVDDGALSMDTNDGSNVLANIDGLTITNGTWSGTEAASGTFTAEGCQLN